MKFCSESGMLLISNVVPDISATVGVSSGVEIGEIESLIKDIEINRDQVKFCSEFGILLISNVVPNIHTLAATAPE